MRVLQHHANSQSTAPADCSSVKPSSPFILTPSPSTAPPSVSPGHHLQHRHPGKEHRNHVLPNSQSTVRPSSGSGKVGGGHTNNIIHPPVRARSVVGNLRALLQRTNRPKSTTGGANPPCDSSPKSTTVVGSSGGGGSYSSSPLSSYPSTTTVSWSDAMVTSSTPFSPPGASPPPLSSPHEAQQQHTNHQRIHHLLPLASSTQTHAQPPLPSPPPPSSSPSYPHPFPSPPVPSLLMASSSSASSSPPPRPHSTSSSFPHHQSSPRRPTPSPRPSSSMASPSPKPPPSNVYKDILERLHQLQSEIGASPPAPKKPKPNLETELPGEAVEMRLRAPESNLLESLMSRESLSRLVLDLFERGFTVSVVGPNGSATPCVHFPYGGDGILEYIDREEIPPVLTDILLTSNPPSFYSGCVICEARDHRSLSDQEYAQRFVLLKPSNQTLSCDVRRLTRSADWTEEERNILASQLLVISSGPLCLDPSPAVGYRLNAMHSSHKSLAAHDIRRESRKRDPDIVSRKRRLPPVTPVPSALKRLQCLTSRPHRLKTMEQIKSSLPTFRPLCPPPTESVPTKFPKEQAKPIPDVVTALNARDYSSRVVEEWTMECDKDIPGVPLPQTFLVAPSSPINAEKSTANNKPTASVLLVRLIIHHVALDDSYIVDFQHDKDHVPGTEFKGTSYKMRYPSKTDVNRYVAMFTEIFTEMGKKAVKITTQIPGQEPKVKFTLGARARIQQQMAQQAAHNAAVTSHDALPKSHEAVPSPAVGTPQEGMNQPSPQTLSLTPCEAALENQQAMAASSSPSPRKPLVARDPAVASPNANASLLSPQVPASQKKSRPVQSTSGLPVAQSSVSSNLQSLLSAPPRKHRQTAPNSAMASTGAVLTTSVAQQNSPTQQQLRGIPLQMAPQPASAAGSPMSGSIIIPPGTSLSSLMKKGPMGQQVTFQAVRRNSNTVALVQQQQHPSSAPSQVTLVTKPSQQHFATQQTGRTMPNTPTTRNFIVSSSAAPNAAPLSPLVAALSTPALSGTATPSGTLRLASSGFLSQGQFQHPGQQMELRQILTTEDLQHATSAVGQTASHSSPGLNALLAGTPCADAPTLLSPSPSPAPQQIVITSTPSSFHFVAQQPQQAVMADPSHQQLLLSSGATGITVSSLPSSSSSNATLQHHQAQQRKLISQHPQQHPVVLQLPVGRPGAVSQSPLRNQLLSSSCPSPKPQGTVQSQDPAPQSSENAAVLEDKVCSALLAHLARRRRMRQEKERERLLGLPPGSGPTSAEEVSAEKEVNVQVQASQQRQRMVSTPQQIQVQSSRPQSAVVTCQSGTQLQNILPLAIQSAGGISSPSSCSTPLLSIVSSAPNVILTKSTAVASCSSTGFPMTTSGTGGVHPATITISQAQALANCSAASGGTVVSINRRPLAPNQQTTRFKVHSNPAGIVTGSNATSGIVASSANVTYLTAPNLVSGLTAQQQQLALQKRRQTYSQQIRVEGSPANVSIGSPSPHSIAAATPTPAAAPPT